VTATAAHARVRVRARVTGTVQGVGFRPYVYRLATDLGLGGHVYNDTLGVVIEAEAPADTIESFLARLRAEAPPLARIESVDVRHVSPTGEFVFEIRPSPSGGEPAALVSPDTATCGDCLRELFNPLDRRHRYPFINCTNCGPRFTIVRGVPYDRALTTMESFEMCDACQAEYDDPSDRRFHAQPNACPECGPSAWLCDSRGRGVDTDDAVRGAARALLEGRVVAVKGLGGFHLAALAADQTAVAELRARKQREDKPFALMAPTLDAVRELVFMEPEEEALIVSRERPIVLMPRRPKADVARAVAPLSPELGVMLPYSPLHHLLLADVGEPIVMTSGNVSDEPIAYRDGEALDRLTGIADLFLLHDRPIETRTDDSVLRTVDAGRARRPLLLRRSRGYVPAALQLPVASPSHVLACGAELKNTFCVAKGERAWVGHHIGDLQNFETLSAFGDGIEHFKRLFAVEPEVVAHDLHPEYLSTKHAHALDDVRLVGVQHHHAHLAACLAEHGETSPAVGAIFDGTGYGTDGSVWGGELLYGDLTRFQRAGYLHPVRMPGGEAAIRQPWRMACAWLVAALGDAAERPATLAGAVDAETWARVLAIAPSELVSPLTTSVGRLFDAVAALCGVRAEVNYEGQAAIELEAVCEPDEDGAYPLPLRRGQRATILDPRPTVAAVVQDLADGVATGVIAARFHNALAEATAEACERVAKRRDTSTVVLSGGVFQNRRLLEGTAARLSLAGLRVLTPECLPPGDGGISYGQAAVAAALLAKERER
jgi:hydrogenase maturation protein HypF